MSMNFPVMEAPTTMGQMPPGLARNDGTIPGIGLSHDTVGPADQRPGMFPQMPLAAPPLPPGPRPPLLSSNQQQGYQQNQGNLPQMPPPNMQQLHPPPHMLMLQQPQFPRPPQHLPHGMAPNIPTSMPIPMASSHSGQMPGQLVMCYIVSLFHDLRIIFIVIILKYIVLPMLLKMKSLFAFKDKKCICVGIFCL